MATDYKKILKKAAASYREIDREVIKDDNVMLEKLDEKA